MRVVILVLLTCGCFLRRANAGGRADLWHDAVRPAFADDRVLLYTSGFFGGSGWHCLQPFQYGKPCFAAGCGNRCAFKENEKGNTGCGQVVPAGFLCIADGHAVFSDGEVLVILWIHFEEIYTF